MKFDVHNHAIPRAAIELLRSHPSYKVSTDGVHWHGGSHVDFTISPSFVDPAAKLKELESRGLDGAVISNAPPLFYYELGIGEGEAMSRAVNSGLAEFCEADPSRLYWMAHVPMQDPTRAANVLREARQQGCVGVHIATSIAGQRLDAPGFTPFWEAVEEAGLTVMIHPGYNAGYPGLGEFYLDNVIGNLLETTVASERLVSSGLLERFPKVRILLVHGGGFFPYGAGRLRHAMSVRPELAAGPKDPFAYTDQLFFDTVTHDKRALAFLVSLVGSTNVVMGTDLPFDMSTPDPIGELTAAVGAQAATRIAETNAARLFGIKS